MASPELKVKVLADLSQFNRSMKGVQSTLKSVGQSVTKVGVRVSAVATTAMAGLGVASVKAFDTQAKAIAQIEAGLRSTNGQVGFTSKQLQKMASDLQKTTLFGDEEILKDATAQLLTFTNITGDQFAKTQVAVLDLATRLDGDLKSASIQLGKALNDPVANLSALSRSGIQFSKSQKDVINSLVESGRLADAQNIILEELQKQYGGSAQAAAEAGAGGITQLKNAIGDLQEDFGRIMVDALNPFIERMKEFFEMMTSQPDEVKKRFVLMGVAIASVGPLLIGLGLALQTLAMGIAIFTSPITAIIAGFILLGIAIDYIRRNFDNFAIDFKKSMLNLQLQAEMFVQGFAQSLLNVAKLTPNLMGGIIAPLQGVIAQSTEEMRRLGTEAMALESIPLQSFAEYWSSVGEDIKSAVRDIFGFNEAFETALDNIIAKTEEELTPTMQNVTDSVNQMSEELKRFAMGISQAFADAIVEGKALSDVLKDILKQIAKQELAQFLFTLFGGVLGGVAGKLGIAGGKSLGAGLAGVILGRPMATGGVVPPGFPNDTYPALLTSGEAVVPKPHALPSMGGAVEVFGEFRVRGSDLVTAISNTNNRTLR